MIGSDVKAWRERNGYSQHELQVELGFRSRTSISLLENQATKIDRTVELALAALEIAPFLTLIDRTERAPIRTTAYPAIDEQQARDVYTPYVKAQLGGL